MRSKVKNLELYAVKKAESLQEFYERFTIGHPGVSIPRLDMIADIGHFNVFKRSGFCSVSPAPYNRRDYYKISLVIGTGILYYPDQQINVDGCALLFTNPNIPYSWEGISEEQSGYFCLFTENFIRKRNESFRESLLSKTQDIPVIPISAEQEPVISEIFQKMMVEMDSDYVYKFDLLRNYVHLLVHEALKNQPADVHLKHTNASTRIASQFIELLERQFPIDSTDRILELKTAHDFAAKLSVHVNHLNHAVKEVTGKTTSEHIARRISNEAIALLKYTEWNISEIAYCLGFEYPANFNIFFKKQTQYTPKSFR
ncbi:helix-turn-helix domain-containing protein [Pedobacter duraquae]|uniref:AraC-like DNA-binding protein n=1 Tax=Pedobacter duraquae TaxID=425511 RepID=A0A4R6IQY0_9SPHI|nr:AraC family transcriptional regulator [Pedobacter duraquae]TDO24804.1 AraC-like DNA-binding protein [Pedobacter duraquae]